MGDIEEDISELHKWVAAHDARSKELWRSQQSLNRRMEVTMERLELRTTSIEKKIIWFCGAAAGIGAVIGTLLPQILLKLGGG